MPSVEPGLVAEPAKRVEAGLGEIVAAERCAADDQGMWERRVVVGERVLEPAPSAGGVRLERVGELFDDSLEQLLRRRLEPIGVEARESEDGVGAGAQRRLRSERADDRVEQAAASG